MTKEKRQMLIGYMVIGVVLIVWSFYMGTNNQPQNMVVTATIKKLSVVNNNDEINAQYNYQGKVFNNDFSIPNNDSLKPDVKVRLLVSPQNPEKLIRYVGVAK